MGIEGRQMSDCSSDIRARRKAVEVGKVAVFREVRPDKAQALKPIEEAAEVFGAWQAWDKSRRIDEATGIPNSPRTLEARDALLDECADVVQATCNLAASLGVRDMTGRMHACRVRNEKRGRL